VELSDWEKAAQKSAPTGLEYARWHSFKSFVYRSRFSGAALCQYLAWI
jgi:hypothetical protein